MEEDKNIAAQIVSGESEIGAILSQMYKQNQLQSELAKKQLNCIKFMVFCGIVNVIVVCGGAFWLGTNINSMIAEVYSMSDVVQSAIESVDIDTLNDALNNLNTAVAPLASTVEKLEAVLAPLVNLFG